MHYGNPYVIPNITGLVRMVTTNHNHTTAWRGYGIPQVSTSMEALMDMLAEKIGMDPFEFRYQNIYRDGDITPNGDKFENIMYTRMFDLARPYYYACKSAQRRSPRTLSSAASALRRCSSFRSEARRIRLRRASS